MEMYTLRDATYWCGHDSWGALKLLVDDGSIEVSAVDDDRVESFDDRGEPKHDGFGDRKDDKPRRKKYETLERNALTPK